MDGMEAKQKYKYQLDPNANTLTKYFSDNRLFYELKKWSDSSAESAVHQFKADHLCSEDLYQAEYRFNPNGNEYTLKYTIHGPKKDYEHISEYQKLGPNSILNHGIKIVNGEIQWSSKPR